MAPWARERGKSLQSSTSAEAAWLLGISQGNLRRLHAESSIAHTGSRTANRRICAAAGSQGIRGDVGANAKVPGTCLKGRWPGGKMQIIAVSRFKGRSAATSTMARLAYGPGLQGCRFVRIDAEPKGSPTSLFGVAP
ncbi:hypothetical protein [Poseidonocella sp. HB161398]|uniref:hypothetical protein n=1 Tax=Poseidonocella sp. HB161398 TaxID=2320855 RepID=UPI001109A023|nr:hypothetical protein [Poseidonocella sp. HB161398]